MCLQAIPTIGRRRALTLLELMTVVAILALLAVLALPRFTGTSDTARTKTNAYNLKLLNAKIEAYYLDHLTWPNTLADLVPDYLPGGVPAPPQSGASYSLDAATHRTVLIE